MDRVSESLLNEFSSERGLSLLDEDKRFEHFVSFVHGMPPLRRDL